MFKSFLFGKPISYVFLQDWALLFFVTITLSFSTFSICFDIWGPSSTKLFIELLKFFFWKVLVAPHFKFVVCYYILLLRQPEVSHACPVTRFLCWRSCCSTFSAFVFVIWNCNLSNRWKSEVLTGQYFVLPLKYQPIFAKSIVNKTTSSFSGKNRFGNPGHIIIPVHVKPSPAYPTEQWHL